MAFLNMNFKPKIFGQIRNFGGIKFVNKLVVAKITKFHSHF